jgi:hypothetical protein
MCLSLHAGVRGRVVWRVVQCAVRAPYVKPCCSVRHGTKVGRRAHVVGARRLRLRVKYGDSREDARGRARRCAGAPVCTAAAVAAPHCALRTSLLLTDTHVCAAHAYHLVNNPALAFATDTHTG